MKNKTRKLARLAAVCAALSGATLFTACDDDDSPAGPGADAGADAGGHNDAASGSDAGADVASDGGASAGEQAALAAVKTYINGNLTALAQAAVDLQKAAPAPDADGWSNSADKPAVDAMKVQWRKARQAYEHIEGAIAILFPELDVSTDERYDGFVEAAPDANLFDGEGVTGIHAIERILWAGETRPEVVTFEIGLPNYKPAAFPKTMQEADDFKNKLCQQLITDLATMRDSFAPLALDPAAAYRGVIGSVAEQQEKITKAETGEEESRYANETLADMRFNVEGGQATQQAFAPWLLATPGGAALNDKITAGFKRLSDALGTGTQLPPVPTTWMAQNPSAADLMTPFGQLYGLLKKEADDKDPASLVSAMNSAADALGIKNLPQ
jgi:iron uptake system component EfeO